MMKVTKQLRQAEADLISERRRWAVEVATFEQTKERNRRLRSAVVRLGHFFRDEPFVSHVMIYE